MCVLGMLVLWMRKVVVVIEVMLLLMSYMLVCLGLSMGCSGVGCLEWGWGYFR